MGTSMLLLLSAAILCAIPHLAYSTERPLRFPKLPLCLTDKVKHHYDIEQPPDCGSLNWTEAKTFKADIYEPVSIMDVVEAHACYKETKEMYYTYYAFFAKQITHGVTRLFAPSHKECKEWITTKVSNVGDLVIDNGIWSTENKVKDSFYYDRTVNGSVVNAHFFKTTLIINKVTREVHSPLDGHVTCNFTAGYCQAKQHVFIMEPQEMNCPKLDEKIATDTPVHIHDNGKIQYLAAPDVDLSFSQFSECPQRVKNCYLSQYESMRCTHTHFIIGIKHGKHTLDSLKAAYEMTVLDPNNVNAEQNVELQLLRSFSLEMDEHLDRLKNQLLQLQCRNTRLHLTNIAATQHVNPSKTLSTLLNREAYATMSSDTLQELHCYYVDALLQPSLRVKSGVNEYIASKPIFTTTIDGKDVEAQWTHNNYLRIGLRDFMTETPPDNWTSIFRIQNRTLTFTGGHLQSTATPVVYELGISTTKIKFLRHDLSTNTMQRIVAAASPPQGYDNIHQGMAALQRLNHVALSVSGVSADSISAFLEKPMTKKENNVFLELMGKLFFVPLLEVCIKWLSSFWAIIGTTMMTYYSVSFLIRFGKMTCYTTNAQSIEKVELGERIEQSKKKKSRDSRIETMYKSHNSSKQQTTAL